MTQVLNSRQKGLIFEIVSARIAEENKEKKHVVYTLQIRYISGTDDLSPSVIERRYTHFLNLYNALKKDYLDLMADVVFPKKVLTGNFDNELISSRSSSFESLFKHILSENVLRNSTALVTFLQEPEVTVAKDVLEKRDFTSAERILEDNFKLLNKVFLDRSSVVLVSLCRLLACSAMIPAMPNAMRWAELALYRYEGVSDSDLLELYVPLLRICTKIWWKDENTKLDLEKRLQSLQQQGIKINNLELMDAVKEVEMKVLS